MYIVNCKLFDDLIYNIYVINSIFIHDDFIIIVFILIAILF